MILITGAAGKTGRAVLEALLRRGLKVRAAAKNREQALALSALGAASCPVGDLGDSAFLTGAMQGVRGVYHICPNMHPEEFKIGCLAMAAAQKNKVEHFVYHSVLHPQAEKMPHHWQKLRVEEALFESGLSFTVLQPAAYMQNTLAYRVDIISKGTFSVPYPVKTKISMVDLRDVAEAAAVVLTKPGFRGAVFELVGTEALTQEEVAAIFSEVLEKQVTAKELSLAQWQKLAGAPGLNSYAKDTLIKMFGYYKAYGFSGNSFVLKKILGCAPQSFASYVAREFLNQQ